MKRGDFYTQNRRTEPPFRFCNVFSVKKAVSGHGKMGSGGMGRLAGGVR